MSQQEPRKDAIEIRLEMSDEQALEFLERLAQDDDFRDRYEREPQGVLEEYGISITGVDFPETATAPPKESLAAAHGELGRMRDEGEADFRFWAWGPAYLVLIRFWRFRSMRFSPGGGDES